MNINESFKSTCKILFGEEVGELAEFEPYLKEMLAKGLVAKSSVSGKEVFLSSQHYSKNAKFIALEEVGAKQPALNVNSIKDIDSILSSLGEFAYCGNKNLGICTNVRKSDSCSDSTEIVSSSEVLGSKYIANCYGMRQSEHSFGCMLGGEVGFCIKGHVIFYSKRCFESYLCFRSTDLYSCFNCRGAADCMFSFNQVSKRNMVGNVELPKEKYLVLKKKLLGEVAQVLRKRKSFPSVFELAGGA